MKDIDFDELDKAVNSLVSQKDDTDQPKHPVEEDVPKPPKPEPVEPAKVEEPSPSPSVPVQKEEPKPEEPKPEPSSDIKPDNLKVNIAPRTKPIQSIAPNRRSARLTTKPTSAPRGSFIDIMAPKPTQKNTSRTGQTIQPVTMNDQPKPSVEEDVPKPPKPEPVEPAKVEEPSPSPSVPVQKEEPKPEPKKAENNPGELSWPDPLDFHDNKDQSEKDKEESQPNLKSGSPFIKGAKVDKRPLGAFSQQSPTQSPKAQSLDFGSLDKQVDMGRDEQMPDELHPDVVAVESDSGTSEYENEKTETQPEHDNATPANEVAHEQPSRQQLHDTAMLSIPKQYQTKEKPADHTARPVFDTKEYHPPLLEPTAPAAHKGGKILKSIAITAIIVAAASAAGYFAFFYFIENF